MLWAIAFATPFFVFWGWLSDKIGRKWIMMAGMALAIFTYRPIFNIFLDDTKPGPPASGMISATPIILKPSKKEIMNNGDSLITYIHRNIKHRRLTFDQTVTDTIFAKPMKAMPGEKSSGVDSMVYSRMSPPKDINIQLDQNLYWKFVGLVFILILYVTMVYGPIAAFLVEMFPTKIRYTSMSLPYHIGNGVFGGLVPFIGLLLTTSFPADPLVGLWYPIGVAALCLLIGTVYLRNKIDENVED